MKLRKRFLIPVLLILALILGPRPSYPSFDSDVPNIDIPLHELDDFLLVRESKIENLKPDNEARIVWADSIRKTPFSLIYLHGWSASQEEGDPIHEAFAKRYGCNLYLPRLAGHGLDDQNSFRELSPKDLVDSAKEALAIGALIGEKIIVMSCSTGGSLSIYLAAKNPELVHAQILFSPNIDIFDPMSDLLTIPWGKQLAYAIKGDHHSFTPPEEGFKYWTTTYSTDGLVCLKTLVEMTMKPSIWKSIEQPFFMGYYYKNEEKQDRTVSVSAMQEFFQATTTPETHKRKSAFPEVGTHVIASRIHSKDLESVLQETFQFAEEVLKLEIRN